MRIADISAAATMLVIAIAALSSPAAATDTGTAVGICTSRGTDCTITNKSDGGYHICVNNGGSQQCVDCPPLMSNGGSCSVAASTSKGKGKGLTVEGIMKQPARKAAP